MKYVTVIGLFSLVALGVSAEEVLSGPPTPPIYVFFQFLSNEFFATWDLFQRGGALMFPILLALIIGLSAALERTWKLRWKRHCPQGFEKDVVHFVDLRGVDAGLTLCNDKKSSLGRLVSVALLRYGTSRSEMENAVADESKRIRYDLNRNSRTIITSAILAPMFGVLGMAVSFFFSFDGMGTKAASTNVISDALLPFSFGLLAAIPLVFLYFVVRTKADDIIREIEEKAIDAVITLDRKARQSIRLIEDLEEHIETKHMSGLKVPDLASEFEDSKDPSQFKSSVTTHAGLPPAPETAAN